MDIELSPRKGRILHAVVDGYVRTSEPIGSSWLTAHHDFGCRAATLRNDMSELAEDGFLLQPHTSAGRIPTQRGYRYYVDRLMPRAPLAEAHVDKLLPSAADVQEDLHEIVRAACRVLAQWTEYPSVASAPDTTAVRLHRLYLAQAAVGRLLLVVLFSTGHVDNRVIEVPDDTDVDAAVQIADSLNERLVGLTLRDLARVSAPRMAADVPRAPDIAERVLLGVVRAAQSASRDAVFVEGANLMLRQREFRDVLRLERLLSALAERSILFSVFADLAPSEDVNVLIGDECTVELLDDCSLVTGRYRVGSSAWGHIGVFGPTRMRYGHAVAAVDSMARRLTAVLARAELA